MDGHVRITYGTDTDQLRFCKSLEGGPETVTGDFEYITNSDKPGAVVKPGFLNGAPLRVDGVFTIYPSISIYETSKKNLSFLWNKKGKITPAFTDNKIRTVGEFHVNVPHAASDKTTMFLSKSTLRISKPYYADLLDMMLPGLNIKKQYCDIIVYRTGDDMAAATRS